MYKVLILMSTYNGNEKIYNQVKSIINQKGVESYIYIRDDGSNDATIDSLKKIALQYTERVKISFQRNVGWKQSFLELVYMVNNVYDYYGFADQDDIWNDDKIISCIEMAEHDNVQGPKLIHCNSVSVMPDLKQRKEQENRVPEPPSFKAAIATEYFQGCGMIWNNAAMTIIQRYHLINKNIAHDYWVGLICYLAGTIYFCDRPLFYHIRYENNSSQDGNRQKGRIKRLKMLLLGENAYMNPAQDLIDGYSDILSAEKLLFLTKLRDYKTNFRYKIEVTIDKEFKRPSISATLLMKMAILFDKY